MNYEYKVVRVFGDPGGMILNPELVEAGNHEFRVVGSVFYAYGHNCVLMEKMIR